MKDRLTQILMAVLIAAVLAVGTLVLYANDANIDARAKAQAQTVLETGGIDPAEFERLTANLTALSESYTSLATAFEAQKDVEREFRDETGKDVRALYNYLIPPAARGG